MSKIYRVIADCEDAYAIWPADRESLPAWRTVGQAGSLEECRAFIAAIETETRAAVLKQKLEGDTVFIRNRQR